MLRPLREDITMGKVIRKNKLKKRRIEFVTIVRAIGHVKDNCFKLHGYLEWFK